MRVSFDATKLLESLKKAEQEITRKLEQMIRGFSYAVVTTATENTPMGDYMLFSDLYDLRKTDPSNSAYGLRSYHGFARGSWNIDFHGELKIVENYGSFSGAKATDQAKQSLLQYTLGDSVMISNQGPYIMKLENNHSKQTNQEGIMQPTMETVMSVLKFNLANYYNQSSKSDSLI